MRYDTASDLDVQGFSLATGLSTRVNATTYGAYIEAGHGEYDSFYTFHDGSRVASDGDTSYYGLGLFFESKLPKNFYLEGSLRAGRSETDYKSSDFAQLPVNFDLHRNYYGAHLGAGKIISLTENSHLDVYTKMLWTKLDSEDAVIRGDKFSFDSINSLRNRTGARYYYNTEEASLYLGAAYEREFDGKAKGFNHATNQNMDAPSLKGNSAILEVGSNIQLSRQWQLNTNFKGYLGDKSGVNGSLKLEYKF